MTLNAFMQAVEEYLDQFLWRFRQLPSDGSVLVVDDPETSFSVREANPISNVAVARPAGVTVTTLKANHDRVYDLSTNEFHRQVEGVWEVMDPEVEDDVNLVPNSLIYSPHDGRFYYVDESFELTDVNLTTDTPGN